MIKQPFRVENGNIVVPNFDNDPDKNHYVPLNVLNAIDISGVSFDAVAEAYWFYTVTHGREYEWTTASEIAGEDLSNYRIYWFDDDYESPRWRESYNSNAVVFVPAATNARLLEKWQENGWFVLCNTFNGRQEEYDRFPPDMDLLLVKRTREEFENFTKKTTW